MLIQSGLAILAIAKISAARKRHPDIIVNLSISFVGVLVFKGYIYIANVVREKQVKSRELQCLDIRLLSVYLTPIKGDCCKDSVMLSVGYVAAKTLSHQKNRPPLPLRSCI